MMTRHTMTRHTRTHGNRPQAFAEAQEASRVEEMSTLITLVVCSVLTIGIILAAYLVDFKISFPLSFAPASEPAHVPPPMAPFKLSGIQLGMTPVEMASVHPEILITDHPSAGFQGEFKLGYGTYGVLFLGPDWGRQAYRISYRETFWNFSEVELRQRLKRKFGPPSVNRCGLDNPRKGWECQLQWRRPDGVVLKANTKTINVANGVSKSRLEFVALDPRLERRLNRKAEKHGVKPIKRFRSRRMSDIAAAMRGQ